MANALKCDRCNGYFDYNPNVDNFISFGHKNIIVGKNFPTKDICPTCMESFCKWFENPDNCECADRSNGATDKELELASKLNDAKIYIAQLKNELGYTMTKEEMDSISVEDGYKDPCKSCCKGVCEQCSYGYISEDDKKKIWYENHKKKTKLSDDERVNNLYNEAEKISNGAGDTKEE